MPGYYTAPTICDEHIVFVCEDDLWSVSLAGGTARRLTTSLGATDSPVLSPDGEWLAFSARDHGAWEVYVMPALGGAAQRLTYQGDSAVVVGWSADNRHIYFATSHQQPFRKAVRLWQVTLDGTEPQMLPYGVANRISIAPDGKGAVLGRHNADAARWKRYRGGTAGQIWVDIEGNGAFQALTPADGNLTAPNWLGDRIYFLSDHEGIGNLYSCLPGGADLTRHTHHEDFYARGAQSDGQRIVYHAGGDIYFYDPTTDLNDRLEIALHSPRIQAQRKYVPAMQYFQYFSLHPKGHSLAVVSRGKLFSMANWEGAVTQHGVQDGVRYHLPEWHPDGKRLVVISDETGEEKLEVHTLDGETAAQSFEALDVGRIVSLEVSPTADQVLLGNHRFELQFVDLESGAIRLLDCSDYAQIQDIAWSPDGKWAAYAFAVSDQIRIIRVVEVATGDIHDVTHPEFDDHSPTWDPEGKYLYFLSDRIFNPIYDAVHFELAFPRAGKPMLVTLRKDVPNPFIPQPPKDEEDTEASQPEEDKPDEDKPEENAEAKGAEKTAPDDVQADQAAAAADEKNDKTKGANDRSGKKEKDTPKSVEIDFEQIQQRVLSFPRPEGRFKQLLAIKGKVLYTVTPIEGSRKAPGDNTPSPSSPQTILIAYNFAQLKEEVLVDGVAYIALSRDGSKLAYFNLSNLRVVNAGEAAMDPPPGSSAAQDNGRSSGFINLDRIPVSVVPQLEWKQIYREAWRLQRDHFWNEHMSGVDWEQVYQRYYPLLDRIATRSEFSDLMWEMQGELGTSHAYEFGGDYRVPQRWRQGHLGADWVYDDAAGGYRITHLVDGDSWDDFEHAPLRAPGLDVREGDIIQAIGGRPLRADYNPGQALENLGNQEVELQLVREPAHPENGDATATTETGADDNKTGQGNADNAPIKKRITAKTLPHERMLRYRAWVKANRRRVHEATEGQVGYLHIPDMSALGYAEFHRGWLAEVRHPGLIIDVRYNGGGHVSQLILEKLARRRIGYDIKRWGHPEPYPMYSVLGPMVALTNENAGSDGDIFSHCFKLMKLGTLIGKRTWGGVIGISPQQRLVDGSMTTQPEYSFWFEDVGWSVENYGTDPDVEVDITPQDYADGRDPQLEKALEIIQAQLAENPPKIPDFSQKPQLPLPKLPDMPA